MNKEGPIIVVEDDPDDQHIIKEPLSELNIKNEVFVFNDGLDAYEYMNKTTVNPFIIISDINMPKMNGIQLRDKMQQTGEIRLRTVPFIFLTTAAANHAAIQAYINSVQGFFTKPGNLPHFKRAIQRIIDYWSECIQPKII